MLLAARLCWTNAIIIQSIWETEQLELTCEPEPSPSREIATKWTDYSSFLLSVTCFLGDSVHFFKRYIFTYVCQLTIWFIFTIFPDMHGRLPIAQAVTVTWGGNSQLQNGSWSLRSFMALHERQLELSWYGKKMKEKWDMWYRHYISLAAAFCMSFTNMARAWYKEENLGLETNLQFVIIQLLPFCRSMSCLLYCLNSEVVFFGTMCNDIYHFTCK